MQQQNLALPQYVFDMSDQNLVPGVNWLQGLQQNVQTLATNTQNSTLQTVVSATGSVATGSTVFPNTSSIPTNSAGDQYMTASITPISAASQLIIDVITVFSCNAAVHLSLGLFKTGTSNALKTSIITIPVGGYFTTLGLRHVIASGSTSSQTFTVRAGPQTSATLTFNGVGGVVVHGGVLTSSIIIREMAGL